MTLILDLDLDMGKMYWYTQNEVPSHIASKVITWKDRHRAFINTPTLVHKHVEMSMDKWISETTLPHKHVQISEDQFF